MNRVDFMNQLERLLQGIAPGERDEALQYYNDYFDDAGKENEQAVIEALGNPARVAENIKRDLPGSGAGGENVFGAKASDRALVEYGKETEEKENKREGSGFFGDSGFGDVYPESSLAQGAWEGNPGKEDESEDNGGGTAVAKAGMPVWAVALLVTLLVFASPVVLGLLGALAGVIVCWYAVILCVGVAAVALLVVFIVLVVTGVICCFVNPWAGMALVGGGLICGGIGLIFLMITVALGGILTPAFWRGCRRLFRRKRNIA